MIPGAFGSEITRFLTWMKFQQRLSNARLRLTFYNAPVAYCGPARPGSAFQQSAVSGLLPRARARRADSGSVVPRHPARALRKGDWAERAHRCGFTLLLPALATRFLIPPLRSERLPDVGL